MRIDSDSSTSDKYRSGDEGGSNADAEKTDESARIETGLTTGDFYFLKIAFCMGI